MPGMESKRIFVAGAFGAVGRKLCTLLIEEGHTVIGTTRKPSNVKAMETLGIKPVLVDVYDAEHLRDVVKEASPAIIVHQLTALPPGLDPARMPEARLNNARLREMGTRNLVEAARAANVDCLVAQSIAFAYAPGPTPYKEDAPLDRDTPDENRAVTVRAVASLEQQVQNGPFIGIVLRYGHLYGPGTGFEVPTAPGSLHVDAAADAARRAIQCDQTGVFNLAEADGLVSIARASTMLHWTPTFRMADPPAPPAPTGDGADDV